MLKVLYDKKIRVFYEKGDIVYDVFDKEYHEIQSVDTKEMKLICKDGKILSLTPNIRATLETTNNCKIIDKRIAVLDSKKIKIKYFGDDIVKLQQIQIGNWIDLRSAETIELKKGEFKLISLGVAMELPKGYEAHVIPRSSTYKNFKIIQVNSMGLIDNSYCGENDVWFFPALAMEDTIIHKDDRICQFRIEKIMDTLEFITVDTLDNEDRGGIGSTGIK